MPDQGSGAAGTLLGWSGLNHAPGSVLKKHMSSFIAKKLDIVK